MVSSTEKPDLPEIKLKKASSTTSSSSSNMNEFQKVKVMNTGDTGIFISRRSADARMKGKVT